MLPGCVSPFSSVSLVYIDTVPGRPTDGCELLVRFNIIISVRLLDRPHYACFRLCSNGTHTCSSVTTRRSCRDQWRVLRHTSGSRRRWIFLSPHIVISLQSRHQWSPETRVIIIVSCLLDYNLLFDNILSLSLVIIIISCHYHTIYYSLLIILFVLNTFFNTCYILYYSY